MNRLLSADAAGDFEAAHVLAHLIALHSGVSSNFAAF
jgi:hypothetical protein